ncbi:hypothetical protein GCM10010341_38400 [Streptomyces noursei]|nr:hypothetical protein GCM10010341_38400 [Streptomyces noursei]
MEGDGEGDGQAVQGEPAQAGGVEAVPESTGRSPGYVVVPHGPILAAPAPGPDRADAISTLFSNLVADPLTWAPAAG